MIDWPISFARPHWLWLLMLVPLFWYIERYSMVALGRARGRWSRILRNTILLCLILGLAGLQVIHKADRLTVIFAIDASDSASEELDDKLADIQTVMSTMERKDSAGMVVFGSEAYVEKSPQLLPKIDRFDTVVDSSHTDLSRAIRLGLGLFPEDTQRRLVLVTDGNENLGDALKESGTAAAMGVPIDVVTIERKLDEEILVEDLSLPPAVDKDEPFEVKITVRSTVDANARLRLLKNGEPVGSQDVELSPGKNVFTFTEVETEENFYTYEVAIESLYDTVRENNTGASYVRVFGKPRVLLVGPEPDLEYLGKALEGENWEVEESLGLPLRRSRFEQWDAIVLANAPSDYFDAGQLKMVHDYVRDQAGGFVMIGGENSFALGKYARTPVEEALPVNMELSNKRHFPSLSMALVIDKSGSMSSGTGSSRGTKLNLAIEAAIEAVEILTQRDNIMVLAFDENPKEIVSLQQVGVRKKEIISDISSVRPGGGTNMYPAFRNAYEALAQTQSQLKHIILLGDGMTHGGSFHTLARQCVADKITVSTVAVGADADVQLMQTIASLGDGRFYKANNANALPRIFARETYLAQRAYLIEEPFIPSIFQENLIVRGLEEFPDVKGYVVTEAKQRSEMVMLTHKGDPLLAVWRYGLGKSGAFTSDAKARWLQSWIGWEGYNKFWPQMVRWILRKEEPSELKPTMRIEQGRGEIIVDAVSENDQFINFLDLRARVSMPDGSEEPAQDVELRQAGPGRYVGEFEARETGTYLTRIYGAEDQGIMPATVGEVVSYPPEYQNFDTNHLLLNRIVDKTGGRLDPPLAELFKREDMGAESYKDLWSWLLLFAALLLPFDIAVRRIYLDPEQMAAVKKRLKGLVAPVAGMTPSLKRTRDAERTMEALKRTKADVVSSRHGVGGDDASIGSVGSGEAAPQPVGEKFDTSETPTSTATGAAVAASLMAAKKRASSTSQPDDPVLPRSRVAPHATADEMPSVGEGDTFSRLRKANDASRSRLGGGIGGGMGADSGSASPGAPPKPAAQPRPDSSSASSGSEGESAEDESGLSYMERLRRARERARGGDK